MKLTVQTQHLNYHNVMEIRLKVIENWIKETRSLKLLLSHLFKEENYKAESEILSSKSTAL